MKKSYNKSIIEKLGKKHLENLINTEGCVSDILRSYGLCENGSGSRTALKRLAKEWNLELKFKQGNIARKHRESAYKRPLEEVFSVDSTVSNGVLRRAILRNNFLDNTTCSICKNKNIWNGKPITFILDHINGTKNDNRIENLRYVCPNCNSQLDTTGSRNSHHPSNAKKYFCIDCGIKITNNSNRCVECSKKQKYKKRLFNPEKNELEKLVWEMPTRKVANIFGVTDKAIERRCRLFGIPKPPRGYWRKIETQKNKAINIAE